MSNTSDWYEPDTGIIVFKNVLLDNLKIELNQTFLSKSEFNIEMITINSEYDLSIALLKHYIDLSRKYDLVVSSKNGKIFIDNFIITYINFSDLITINGICKSTEMLE